MICLLLTFAICIHCITSLQLYQPAVNPAPYDVTIQSDNIHIGQEHKDRSVHTNANTRVAITRGDFADYEQSIRLWHSAQERQRHKKAKRSLATSEISSTASLVPTMQNLTTSGMIGYSLANAYFDLKNYLNVLTEEQINNNEHCLNAEKAKKNQENKLEKLIESIYHIQKMQKQNDEQYGKFVATANKHGEEVVKVVNQGHTKSDTKHDFYRHERQKMPKLNAIENSYKEVVAKYKERYDEAMLQNKRMIEKYQKQKRETKDKIEKSIKKLKKLQDYGAMIAGKMRTTEYEMHERETDMENELEMLEKLTENVERYCKETETYDKANKQQNYATKNDNDKILSFDKKACKKMLQNKKGNSEKKYKKRDKKMILYKNI